MLADNVIIENYQYKCDTISGVSMLIPEKDASRINELINDPSIRPWVAGDFIGILDATPFIKNPDNIFFVSEHGGVGFIKTYPHTYECHSFILPSGRGKWMKKNFVEVKEWIFSNTDATQIVTLCPKDNGMAIGAARICGFRKYSTLESLWKHNDNIHDMDAYIIYRDFK